MTYIQNTTGFLRTHIKTIIITIAGIIAVFALLLFFTLRSLPGGSLYAFKVNLYEEAIESVYLSPALEAQYQLSLLDRRASELRTLREKESVDEESLRQFVDETIERSQEIIALLAAFEGGEITFEQSLNLSNELQTKLRIIETIADRTPHLSAIEEEIEDERREAGNIFDDRAEAYVLRATDEEVRAYITELLTTLSELVAGYTLDRFVMDDIEDGIENTQEELLAGEGDNAIKEVAETIQLATAELELAAYGIVEENRSTSTPASDSAASSTPNAASSTNASSSIKIISSSSTIQDTQNETATSSEGQ